MAFAMTPGQSSASFASSVVPNLKGNIGQNAFVPQYHDDYGTGKGNLNVFNIGQLSQTKVGKPLVAGVVDKLRTVVDVAKANGADPNIIKQAEGQLAMFDKMPDSASISGLDMYSLGLIENRVLGATQAKQAQVTADTKQQTLENDKERLKVEQQQVETQRQDVELRRQQQHALGIEQMNKTGINPYTNEQLSLQNAPDTALVDDKGRFGTPGAVIPMDKAGFYKPTQTERVTADTARQVLAISADLRQEIAAHPGIIGPLMGRKTKALASLGLGSERAQKLIDDVTFLQSAATKMHTSRFSNQILDKMGTLIDGKMNVDQFKGGLDSIEEIAGRYAQEDQMMSVGSYKAKLAGNGPNGGQDEFSQFGGKQR